MTPTTIIKQNYNDMLEQLLELQKTLHQAPPCFAYAANIEPVPLEKEWTLNTELNPELVITPLNTYEGKAIKLACESYLDLHVIPGVSQRLARRTPGMLWINPQQNPLASKVEQLCSSINQAKTNITNCVTETHTNAHDRFDLLKDALPASFTFHIYRHIRCFNNHGFLQMSFSWVRQQALLKANKTTLLENIANACEDSNNQNILVSLEALATAVAQTPEANLRMRRTQPVQPVASTRALGSKNYTPYTAAMPIVVIQPKMPVFKPLPVYDHQARLAAARKPRSDRKQNDYLGHFYGHIIEATK